jgi:hypothetical protein
MWPQRFGQTWSSIMMPATPASSIWRTMWKTLSALP